MVRNRPGLLAACLEKTMKPKIKIFQDLGFSAEDIAEIISNTPSILYRSLDNGVIPSLSGLMSLLGSSAEVAKGKLKEVKEVLLATEKYDISCIVSNPGSFICSLEKMIKPRMQVLGILYSRN
ncbi:unnamed protein product [Fraxinus pennsylvanica]|uniref:Uncharacterized protein n=1 Tax=Fraxinus pennsylvanica TaxID=56036 RepID=A0AAD2E5E5_9LAMI|nr:unnamed protein product [Fraxinus pennsylvanica]